MSSNEIFYQPIIAIENNSVYGYEVVTDESRNSVGFENSICVNETQIKKSLQHYFSKCNGGELFFVPMSLEEISNYCKNPSKMPLITYANAYEIDFRKIVIEIDESDFEKELNTSVMALSYCRSKGIRLALNKFGKSGIDVLRLSQISPDFIKIDKRLVHESENNAVFKEFLANQTDFLSKLGIEVIYSGIENDVQLKNCVNASGRFFQGNFLKAPVSQIDSFNKSDVLEECFIKAMMRFNKKNSKKAKLKCEIDEVIDVLIERKAFAKNRDVCDERIMNSADVIPNYIKRIYLCNRYGFQTTSNIEFSQGTITLVDNFNKNWAWRKYFKEALFNINSQSKSYITHSYNDIGTNEKIYTYVNKINSFTYLFADISLSCI